MSQGAATNTWDIAPARRPSLDDMGGGVAQNDPKSPPDPNRMPTAEQYNQLQQQCQALAKVASAFLLDVVNNGSTASLSRFSAAGTNIVNGTFTLLRVSVGYVRITWASGTFPVSVASSFVQMTTDAAWCQPVPLPISNGIEVKTRNSAGALTDGNFTIAFN